MRSQREPNTLMCLMCRNSTIAHEPNADCVLRRDVIYSNRREEAVTP